MLPRLTLCFATLVLVAPSVASAHLNMSWPPMRGGTQKTGPCEGVLANAQTPTILAPGSELKIQITETIAHPGHFRIMFDADTTDGEDFPDPLNCDDVGTPDGMVLLADKLLPAQGGTCPDFHLPSERTPTSNAAYEFVVTLPNIECDNCAIQVIQIMTDAGKADADGNWDPTGGKGIYFRCSSITLTNAIEPDTDPDPDPDPDPEPDPDNPDPDVGDVSGPVTGGCAAGGSSSGSLAFAMMALVLGLARRRRR